MLAKEFSLGDDFPKIEYATLRKGVEGELKGIPFNKKMVSHTYVHRARPSNGSVTQGEI